jgi:hypothetical protein
MMELNNYKSLNGILRFILIPLFPAFFICLTAAHHAAAQVDLPPSGGTAAGLHAFVPGFDGDIQTSDDISTLQGVRRFVTENISYPASAVEAGHAGTVELYARVNSDGRINEVLKLQPVTNYVNIEEIVVRSDAAGAVQINEASRHEDLVCEGRRAILTLPRLNMPELHGGVLKFTIRFVLQ